MAQDTNFDETPTASVTDFEDRSLAEVVGQLWHAPRSTLQALVQVTKTPRYRRPERVILAPRPQSIEPPRIADTVAQPRVDGRLARQFGLRLAALIIAWWGTGILANSPIRTEEIALRNGLPFLLAGFGLWIVADVYGEWPALQRWLRREATNGEDEAASEAKPATPLIGLNPTRLVLAVFGLAASIVTLFANTDNQFTTIGVIAWLASILLWVGALSPPNAGPGRWLQTVLTQLRGWRWNNGTLWALVAILILGAAFRLADLENTPPEMTSDHVEKIMDSFGVLNGQHNIFFANNGGREPFQMYTMALVSQVPGLGMNHFTLKLLSAVEGLIAIVVLYWMGREVVGSENRQLGNLTGLVLAALVAASYWHTGLSRLGLRIVLTTAVTGALLVFLAQAMRHNRREDYIKAGLVLGFGLYTYQAVRMLPVVIIVGVGLAFLFNARSLRDRGRYFLNFVTLVLIAFVVFVPLFSYSLQFPEDFWRRTSGRLLGDDVITTTDEAGNIVERHATISERIEAFNENVPILANNVRNALLMFNWKGDVAWINGSPNAPTMDTFSGSLLIIGLAAWAVRMVRRRDVFDWLIPLALVIMLLPSALAIAYPVENPSHTRTSGALPAAYLIAALPLALLSQSVLRLAPGRRGQLIVVGMVTLIVLGSYTPNTRTYFVDHVNAYIGASLPHSEAGRVLRGFAESDGTYGNAFLVGFPHWWDHRAVGIAGGKPDWPNGVVSLNQLKTMMVSAINKVDDFRLDVERDLLFFVSVDDVDGLAWLENQFPDGRATLRQSYQYDDQYMLYRVPALGEAGFNEFVQSE